MFEEQLTRRDITDARVLKTMLKVPRHEFVPDKFIHEAYEDHPIPIGHGQTISQPYIVAYMTQEIDPKSSDRILEIGTGCGYQTAILAELSHEVFSIEFVHELAKEAQKRLERLEYQNIETRTGDGYLGWEEKAPFDCIIVTAAVDHVPTPLLNQLAIGGRMILPVGDLYSQVLHIISKDTQGKPVTRFGHAVRFVPFVRTSRKV